MRSRSIITSLVAHDRAVRIPQHLAEIGEATRIIAIKKDRDAPIFDLAELGIVGDWREVLPLLREELHTAE